MNRLRVLDLDFEHDRRCRNCKKKSFLIYFFIICIFSSKILLEYIPMCFETLFQSNKKVLFCFSTIGFRHLGIVKIFANFGE